MAPIVTSPPMVTPRPHRRARGAGLARPLPPLRGEVEPPRLRTDEREGELYTFTGWHGLPFLRDLHRKLAAIAAI
jgi:hypothetical protein